MSTRDQIVDLDLARREKQLRARDDGFLDIGMTELRLTPEALGWLIRLESLGISSDKFVSSLIESECYRIFSGVRR